MRRPILHVDDNEDDALLLRTAFGMAGLCNRLLRVCDGQEAVNYLSGTDPYSDRLLYNTEPPLDLAKQKPRTSLAHKTHFGSDAPAP